MKSVSRGTWMWIADKVGTPILTGIVTGISVAVFAIIAAPWIAESIRQPTCDDPLDLAALSQDEMTASGKALAPDDFPNKGRVTYEASNLVDGNSSTAWVEGEEGLGIGATVTIEFEGQRDVQMVCVVNGYAESWELYSRNSRIRQMETATENGRQTSLLRDPGSRDSPAQFQQVQVASGPTGSIVMIIRSAYAAQAPRLGTAGYADTSMSEVEVWVSR